MDRGACHGVPVGAGTDEFLRQLSLLQPQVRQRLLQEAVDDRVVVQAGGLADGGEVIVVVRRALDEAALTPLCRWWVADRGHRASAEPTRQAVSDVAILWGSFPGHHPEPVLQGLDILGAELTPADHGCQTERDAEHPFVVAGHELLDEGCGDTLAGRLGQRVPGIAGQRGPGLLRDRDDLLLRQLLVEAVAEQDGQRRPPRGVVEMSRPQHLGRQTVCHQARCAARRRGDPGVGHEDDQGQPVVTGGRAFRDRLVEHRDLREELVTVVGDRLGHRHPVGLLHARDGSEQLGGCQAQSAFVGSDQSEWSGETSALPLRYL